MFTVRGNGKSLSRRVRTTAFIETHGCSVCPVEFSLLGLVIDHTKQPVTQNSQPRTETAQTKDEGYDDEEKHSSFCANLSENLNRNEEKF